jgi:hypothetical protein
VTKMDSVDFYMDSQLVGAFPGSKLPTIDGSYGYEAYRSLGTSIYIENCRLGKRRAAFIKLARNASPSALQVARPKAC